MMEMQRQLSIAEHYSLQPNRKCGPPDIYSHQSFSHVRIMQNPNRKPNTNSKKATKPKKTSPFNTSNVGASATSSSSSLTDNIASSVSGSINGQKTISFIKVMVFNIDNPEKFYLKINATHASVDQFQKVCNRAGLEYVKPKTIEVDEMYLVSVENKWHRGKVLKIEGGKRYLVFFIDFGKQDYVEKSRLVKIVLV